MPPIGTGEPLYAMTFPAANPDGIPMPDSLKVAGHETLELRTDGCNMESRIGIALYPAGSAISGTLNDTFTLNSASAEVVLAAGAVAKVHVDYSFDYECPDPETLSGESIFTFFPSGRVVREDINVKPSNDRLDAAGNMCGCEFAGEFFFTSFWSFTPVQGNLIDAGNNFPTDSAADAACTMYPTHGVAVRWQDSQPTRYKDMLARSHIYDFARAAQTVDPMPRAVTSAIQMTAEPGSCAALIEMLNDPPLMVGDEPLGSSGHDGIYRPENAHDGETVITSNVRIPAGWAISIDLGGAEHAVVSRDPPIDDFYRVSRDPDEEGHFLFVFPHALEPGDAITIDPQS